MVNVDLLLLSFVVSVFDFLFHIYAIAKKVVQQKFFLAIVKCGGKVIIQCCKRINGK